MSIGLDKHTIGFGPNNCELIYISLFILPVSAGKSTVLNALLGDKFSKVALKRTTAGVNFFRIIQSKKRKRTESDDANSEDGLSTIADDDKEIRGADDINKEISSDNKELRSCDAVTERTFDIRVGYPICEMRKDTQLVLIDIPSINEADSSKKYKDYVKSNWKTFDCVVLVMDAVQGVNTQEQVDLLEFVQRNNKELKDLPTIILGNKMDDLDDEDTIHQIEETRAKTIEIFGNVDCSSVPGKAKGDGKVDTNATESDVTKTAFIPLSAKNAFMYMRVGTLDLNQLDKHQDIVEKIGIDEHGRKFSKMKQDDKIKAFRKILDDEVELSERLDDTNFNSFLDKLSDFIGGDAKQKDILVEKVSIELKSINIDSIGKKSVSEFILKAHNKCKLIGLTDFDWIKKTFWKVYLDREDKIFENTSTIYTGPDAMKRLFEELKKYYYLTLVLEWADESRKTVNAMKNILLRQLSFLLEKLEGWSFEAYCRHNGGERYDASNHDEMWQLPQIVTTGEYKYFIRDDPSYAMRWKDGWISPQSRHWQTLSPQDWIVILESLSLVWNQTYFVKDFGTEKVKLSTALAKFRGTFLSISGIHLESSEGTNYYNRLCLHAYNEEIRTRCKGRAASMAQITMPKLLSDPSHWGYLGWEYTNFCRNL